MSDFIMIIIEFVIVSFFITIVIAIGSLLWFFGLDSIWHVIRDVSIFIWNGKNG